MTQFLVTGCGRSGTAWAAELFTALGYPCTHEGSFSYEREGPLEGSDSSWLAMPHLDNLPPATPIIHLVRDPYLVVQSAMAKGFLADMTDPFALYATREWGLPSLQDDHLGRVIRWVLCWDIPLMLRARMVLRVESPPPTIADAVRYATGEVQDIDRVRAALESIGTQVNTSTEGVQPPSMEEVLAHPDAYLIAHRAERFGYDRRGYVD